MPITDDKLDNHKKKDTAASAIAFLHPRTGATIGGFNNTTSVPIVIGNGNGLLTARPQD